jgi:sugar lactone lactonase YvrE
MTNGFTRVLKVAAGFIDIVANATNNVSPPATDGTPALLAHLGASAAAFDAVGNMYVGDTLNQRIWKIDALTGTVKTVVGGGTVVLDNGTMPSATATEVRLFSPTVIALDPAGSLYTTDGPMNRILKITAHGYQQPLDGTETVTVFAGNGTSGFSGDGGPAAAAQLAGPGGLTFDSTGNLYFTESVNFRVRQVDLSGTIHTVAGTGVAGFSGDGGPALAAQIRGGQLAFDSSGNLYLTDTVNNVVRVLDHNPPVISGMPAFNCALWPPDGRTVRVASVTAEDSGAGLSPDALQVSATSNEPHSTSQIAITPNRWGGFDVFLEAARLGSGTGRLYTVTATARDRAGNVSTTTARCIVPHDEDR